MSLKDKSFASVLLSTQQLSMVFWVAVILTMLGPQRKARLSHLRLYIFLFLILLQAVFMLHFSYSLLFHLHSAAFQPLNSLCNSQRRRDSCTFHLSPEVSIQPNLQYLAKSKQAFLSLPAAPLQQNVICNNEQYIVNK